MYQVRAEVVNAPRAAFISVDADTAAEAKRIVKAKIEAHGHVVKKMTAKKVW